MHPGHLEEAAGPWSFIIPPPQRMTSGGAESGVDDAPVVPATAPAVAPAPAINTAILTTTTTTTTVTSQSRMENFRKVKTLEEGSPPPFLGLPSSVVEMKVKEGSKIRNLMGFAMGRMESADTRQIVFSGYGRAVTKTITCVEIMKRKLGGLHQVTRVRYKTLLEVWESKDPQGEGQAERLTVHKNVPSVCILLSKDPLDPNQMGYQPPDSSPEGLWSTESGSFQDGAGVAPKGVKRRLVEPRREDQANKKAQVHTLQENLGW